MITVEVLATRDALEPCLPGNASQDDCRASRYHCAAIWGSPRTMGDAVFR